ncbi:MAG: HD domain-containing protein [Acidimicrobiia bacterium]|nr:HD domain-containing protein [Acidimicrobiia bacterium]
MTPETVPHGGLADASRRTDAVDADIRAAVADLWTDAPGRLALVAVGSYGRRELAPHSDVDILVLHDLRRKEDVTAITRTALYPLWDLGLELGYAVRTVPECLRWARDDPVIATTLFDTRIVAGDASLLADLGTALEKWRRRHTRDLEKSLLAGLEDRYVRYGDAGVDLEPHIKEGRGGLRDLHTLRWLGHDDDALTGALDCLLAVRETLHTLSGRREDRITRELLEEAAKTLTPDAHDPRDALLAAVWSQTRLTGIRLGWLAQTRLNPPGKRVQTPTGFGVEDDTLVRVDARPPEADPEAGLLAAAAAGRIAPSEQLATWARQGERPFHWTEGTRTAFLDFLRSGQTAGWELLDVTGLWTRYVPELEPVRYKAQHNALHRLGVDAHCWETVMQTLRMQRDDAWLAAAVWAELERPELLLLAALLHDAGKGLPGDHARQGVILARRFCERAGFGADVQETVAFLVDQHLTLPDFATGRDLSDEDLVIDLATRIGDGQRLRLLYLLALADARATGPAAWSTWKAELLMELFVRLATLIEAGDLVGRDARNRWERARAEVLRSVPAADREDAADELAGFPRRYLLAQSPADAVAHLDMIRELREDGTTMPSPRVAGGARRCSIVSRDRPGLLSTIAGVLSVRGIAIHTAEVFTRSDGIAVDVLGVIGPGGHDVDTAVWEKVGTDLDAALDGHLDLGAALAARADRYREAVPAGASTTVVVDDAASAWYTVVEVRAPDRIGLLHDLTAVLSGLGLDVHFARVATQAGEARDSFSVRTLEGTKVTDPDRLEADIRQRLAPIVHQAREPEAPPQNTNAGSGQADDLDTHYRT